MDDSSRVDARPIMHAPALLAPRMRFPRGRRTRPITSRLESLLSSPERHNSKRRSLYHGRARPMLRRDFRVARVVRARRREVPERRRRRDRHARRVSSTRRVHEDDGRHPRDDDVDRSRFEPCPKAVLTRASSSSTDGADDYVPWTDPSRLGLVALWLGLGSVAALVAPKGTTDFDMNLVTTLIGSPFSGAVNPIFESLFNSLGVVPAVYAALLLPGAKDQPRIPTVPPLAASFALGFFALGPYLIAREPREDPVAKSSAWDGRRGRSSRARSSRGSTRSSPRFSSATAPLTSAPMRSKGS